MSSPKHDAEAGVFVGSLLLVALMVGSAAAQAAGNEPVSDDKTVEKVAAISELPKPVVSASDKNIDIRSQKAASRSATRTPLKVDYSGITEPLTHEQLKDLLASVGFEGKALRYAWAVAMKESGGRPLAHNKNRATGDNSYGLFQINMLGDLGPTRREKFDLKSNEDLFDPVTNARIAFHMSDGGRDWGSWGIGPNAYNGGKSGNFHYWLPRFPE